MKFSLRILGRRSGKSNKPSSEDASEGNGRISDSVAPPAALQPQIVQAAEVNQTSSVSTTTQLPPSPEQTATNVAQPHDEASLGPPRPRTTGEAVEIDESLTSDDLNLWAQAYSLAQEREAELMTAYREHLVLSQGSDHDDAAAANLSTRDSVEAIVKGLRDNREQKQWRLSFLGSDAKIRDQVDKLTKFLLWSDPLVKSAVSKQPYAALAWSGVSLLLPLITSATTQNEAMLKGFNRIGDLHMFWRICEKTHLRSVLREEYEHFAKSLARLYSYFIEYQARVICHLSSSQSSRAWQDMTSATDWESKMEEINDQEKNCRATLDVSQDEEIRKNRDEQLKEMKSLRSGQEEMHRTIKENIQDEREKELLRDLADAAGDYHSTKDINPKRVPGTCEWFLADERFLEWRDSGSSRLLWASAGPGRGKSVLSRSLIDEGLLKTTTTTITFPSSGTPTSAETKSVICYFFFKDGLDGRMDGSHALCAILHQLFTTPSTAGLIRHALQKHKENGKVLMQKFSDLWQILESCVTSPESEEIVCILDALDECRKDSRSEIIRALEAVSDTRVGALSKLKFLVTSRPYEDLESSFNRIPASAAYLHFDGDDKSEQIGREIDLVIDALVPEITAGFTAEAQLEISKRLKGMESRTYLWLHLTFDVIKSNPSMYGKFSKVKNRLDNLPSSVADAYEEILRRNEIGSEEEILMKDHQTETLLRLVLAAARPLELEEVNEALTLALEPVMGTYEALRSECWPENKFKGVVGGLCSLFITVHDNKLYFIHQTAREFLVDSKRNGKWQGRLNDLSKAHEQILAPCLQYLHFPELDRPIEVFDLAGDGEPTDDIGPFLYYASEHWILHYNSVYESSNSAAEFLRFARMLFRPSEHRTNTWAQIYFDSSREHLDGWTELALASHCGVMPIVETMLKDENVHVDAHCKSFGAALGAASARGHLSIVETLLRWGANPNGAGRSSETVTSPSPLYFAVNSGHTEVVHTLLEAGANVNGAVGLFDTPLCAASKKGNKSIVHMLLEHGADVNVRDGIWGTALIRAARGHTEIVQMLLEHGADVNVRHDIQGTALTQAARGGHTEIVQMLLKHGADVDARADRRGTALIAAAGHGRTEIVRMLLEKGANIEMSDDFDGTALHQAADIGDTEIAKILLDHGADVNALGPWGETPLCKASGGGYEEGNHKPIVQLLLQRGADPTLQSKFGTALHVAAEKGQKDIVQMLLDHGADVNALDFWGETPLHMASRGDHEKWSDEEGSDEKGNYKEIVQLLLKRGANPRLQSKYGTALHVAARWGQKDIEQMLLDHGADVNALDPWGDTPLHLASEGGREEGSQELIVQLLLQSGADPTRQSGDGTALHMAAREGEKDIMQFLLEGGADANALDPDGRTALHVAAEEGQKDLVQMLLDWGADVNSQNDRSSETPLHLASRGGYVEESQEEESQEEESQEEESQEEESQEEESQEEESQEEEGQEEESQEEGSYKETVQLLLKNGADPRLQSRYGTALHVAARWGQKDIEQMLLDGGADANALDPEGRTALQVASI